MAFNRLDFKTLSVTRLVSSSRPSVKFYLHLSWDLEALSSDFTGVGASLSERAGVTLLFRVPADCRLCTVKIKDSFKANNRRSARYNMLFVSAYASTNCVPGAIMNT